MTEFIFAFWMCLDFRSNCTYLFFKKTKKNSNIRNTLLNVKVVLVFLACDCLVKYAHNASARLRDTLYSQTMC